MSLHDLCNFLGLIGRPQKFSELIDLYRGKKMHDKALSLLKEYANFIHASLLTDLGPVV